MIISSSDGDTTDLSFEMLLDWKKHARVSDQTEWPDLMAAVYML